MAEVIGPTSHLPGHAWDLPERTACDDHPDRPAVARIQGETDSFGAELNDMCQECLDRYRHEVSEADHSGTCEWCKQHKPHLRPYRDFEEGMAGRVYDVCGDCIRKQNEELEREDASSFHDAWEDYVEDLADDQPDDHHEDGYY